jgi:hypothetical protein
MVMALVSKASRALQNNLGHKQGVKDLENALKLYKKFAEIDAMPDSDSPGSRMREELEQDG